MLPNPLCPICAAKILALKATVVLLMVQTLLFLAADGALSLVIVAAGLYTLQQRRAAQA